LSQILVHDAQMNSPSGKPLMPWSFPQWVSCRHSV